MLTVKSAVLAVTAFGVAAVAAPGHGPREHIGHLSAGNMRILARRRI